MIRGSCSNCAPLISEKRCDSRKSRLPCMTKQGTPLALSVRSPAMAADCAESGASSPIHDSNRSPRMYKAAASFASLCRNSRNCATIAGRVASMCKSEMKSVLTADRTGFLRFRGCGAARAACGSKALDLQDHDRFYRRFVDRAVLTRGDIADAIDHVHAVDHAAEDRITPTRGIGIERGVVVQIHIELTIASMRILAAGQTHRAPHIAQAIARFVVYSERRGFGGVVDIEAAALNDETGDYAVNQRVGVMAGIDVGQNIGHGQRRSLLVQFDGEVPHRCEHLYLR